ncbi:efflux RND transporter periplasmic adaptor subunit [Schlesneria paludicola]|uniref:efflux RND transporter periplasmic adaptor subunit n=1 Tax=Schlesneria paludicola TaxID=360056 RepID=UPI000299DB09|nr:HlyD family efflux transporter periplasmic adaptor subunit [Schlesneria paludicola]
MIRTDRWFAGIAVALAGTTVGALPVFAQASLPIAAAGDQIVIKREACRVVEPHKFRVPLATEALQTVTLVAPFDGTIKQVSAKTNAKVQAQSDVVRLETAHQKLLLARAQAALKLAAVELRQAGKEDASVEMAQARVDLAQVDVDLAKLALDQAMVRMPFAGEVQRILVSEGQFVRAGDPLAVVADSRMIKVEIPVERSAAENGKPYAFKIEQAEVEGKIDAVLPLPSKFDSLRELFDSIASVQVVIDNAGGKFKVGQTVYVPLIPRQPVVEVPNSAVGNSPEGHRKVQVVRQLIVRDIPVTLLGQVGSTRVFVSGPFADGDEVIYETSHQLGDAFQLKPSGATTASVTPSTNGQPASSPTAKPTTTPAPTTPKQVGF